MKFWSKFIPLKWKKNNCPLSITPSNCITKTISLKCVSCNINPQHFIYKYVLIPLKKKKGNSARKLWPTSWESLYWKCRSLSSSLEVFNRASSSSPPAVLQAVRDLRHGDLPQTFSLWQLRLVVELWDSRMLHGDGRQRDALLTTEFLPVMKNTVDVALDDWLRGEARQSGHRSCRDPTRSQKSNQKQSSQKKQLWSFF